jgi:hypothetical protein
MCDYSLMEFPNRLATEGEMLVVHRFRSGCNGLTAPVDCIPAVTGAKKSFWSTLKELFYVPEPPRVPAVCIPPGARLIIHDVPAPLQKELGIGSEEEVKFVQTSALENQHRDAVRFRTGHTLRLQELTVGQRVKVVDLGDTSVEEPDYSSFETMPAQRGRDWR